MSDEDFIYLGVDALDAVAGHSVETPDEVLMRKEDGDDDVSVAADVRVERAMVARHVLCFIFADVRCREAGGWRVAAAAVSALYENYVPGLWFANGAVDRKCGVLPGGLGRGISGMRAMVNDDDAVADVLSVLARNVGVNKGGWLKNLTQRFYSLVKILDESLVGRMSLEAMGDVFCEGNKKGARARWLARNNQALDSLAGAGTAENFRARYHKSSATRERCRAAQKGNRNRVKGIKGKKKKI